MMCLFKQVTYPDLKRGQYPWLMPHNQQWLH